MKNYSKSDNASIVVDKDVETTKPVENELDNNPIFDERPFVEDKKGRVSGFLSRKSVDGTSVTSKDLWREVNLFWPETIAITATIVLTIAVAWFSRFISINSLEQIRPTISDQAYIELATMVSNMNTLTIAIGAIPLLVILGFFIYRLFVFQPSGDKFLTARFKTTGGVRLSVDTLKGGKLKFNPRDPLSEEIVIKDPRKHFLDQSGKPIIVLVEGDDTNANITKMAGEISQKSKDTNSINDMMFDFGVRWERKMREKANDLFTPMNIILGLILIALVFLGFIVLNQPDAIVGKLG